MNVVFTKQALKELNHLDSLDRKRIITGVKALSAGTVKYEKMEGNPERYRQRIGDYRVIFTISQDNTAIITATIIKVGHRREVYR